MASFYRSVIQLISEIYVVFGDYLHKKNVSIGYLFKCHKMTHVDVYLIRPTCDSVHYDSKVGVCLKRIRRIGKMCCLSMLDGRVNSWPSQRVGRQNSQVNRFILLL